MPIDGVAPHSASGSEGIRKPAYTAFRTPSLLGEAIQTACRDNGLRRMNYEILGNGLPVVHAHVFPRYDWEPADRVSGPVWLYPKEQFYSDADEYDENRHGALRAAIESALMRLMAANRLHVFDTLGVLAVGPERSMPEQPSPISGRAGA